MDDEPLKTVAQVAYELWEEADKPVGRDLEFWLAAEAEVAAEARADAEWNAGMQRAAQRHADAEAAGLARNAQGLCAHASCELPATARPMFGESPLGELRYCAEHAVTCNPMGAYTRFRVRGEDGVGGTIRRLLGMPPLSAPLDRQAIPQAAQIAVDHPTGA